MAEKFLERFQNQIEGFTLLPSSGGCFELKLDEKLVYSKLATGEFPDIPKLLDEVGKQLG